VNTNSLIIWRKRHTRDSQRGVGKRRKKKERDRQRRRETERETERDREREREREGGRGRENAKEEKRGEKERVFRLHYPGERPSAPTAREYPPG